MKQMRQGVNTSEAYWRSVIVGIITLIPVLILWFISQLVVYFAAGGDLGGYGAGPEESNVWWQDPARIPLAIGAIILDAWIIMTAYKHFIKKQKSNIAKVEIPRKMLWTAISIPLLASALYLGYGWFSENKSGWLNPYTDECIRIGAKGAKGAGCVWNQSPEICTRTEHQDANGKNYFSVSCKPSPTTGQ